MTDPEKTIFRIGELLSDTYEIRAVLGCGGMGQVFDAQDVGLVRRVAIKANFADIELRFSIRNEARALAALRHPGVVSVYALGCHHGIDYMVMEHVRSADPVVRTLERFITSNIQRQLTLQEMARATATSPRTLARKIENALGTTPLRFAQRLRVAQAVHLLESTRRSVDEVAARVGYADAAAFRRVFRRETGEAPRARRAPSNANVRRR